MADVQPALLQLLRSTRYNLTQINADLAANLQRPTTPTVMYHQGYQNGRKAELENLVTLLEILTDH